MKYGETVQYLYGLQQHGIKFGLDNITNLLSALHDPHKAFSSVHIAGTNGKGSTSAIIASLLQSAGLRVGLFTSPHLVSFTERIRINGKPITEHDVIRLADEVRGVVSQSAGLSPTFFEVVTAMALLFFERKKTDIAVIEVGMGGRLDATNILSPEVSVITNISFDHKEFLGRSLGEIAFEKAGIIKKSIPVVASLQGPEAKAVIEQRAKEERAALFFYGNDFSADMKKEDVTGITFDYADNAMTIRDLELPLAGMHQMQNASVAIKAATLVIKKCPLPPSPAPPLKGGEKNSSSSLLPLSKWKKGGVSIPSPLAGEGKGEGDGKSPNEPWIHCIREGLRNVKWPGRLEFISEKPPVLIDGAHNPAAAAVLAQALKRTFLQKYKKIIMILGIMNDKDIKGIMEPLLPLASHIICTSPAGSRAASAETLAEVAASLGFPAAQMTRTVKEALGIATQIAMHQAPSTTPLIIVTGSFYTAGETKEMLGQKGVLGGLRE
jgi:dihydrofolate synthase / folylpolyglutamate synthase